MSTMVPYWSKTSALISRLRMSGRSMRCLSCLGASARRLLYNPAPQMRAAGRHWQLRPLGEFHGYKRGDVGDRYSCLRQQRVWRPGADPGAQKNLLTRARPRSANAGICSSSSGPGSARPLRPWRGIAKGLHHRIKPSRSSWRLQAIVSARSAPFSRSAPARAQLFEIAADGHRIGDGGTVVEHEHGYGAIGIDGPKCRPQLFAAPEVDLARGYADAFFRQKNADAAGARRRRSNRKAAALSWVPRWRALRFWHGYSGGRTMR